MNGFFRTAALFSAALIAGCASSPERVAKDAAGEGRVLARLVAGESPLPRVTVTAVRDVGVEFQEREYGAVAAADDTAVLLLPAGSYYLSALSADGSVFGYYGPNPVQVRRGEDLTVSIRGLEGNEPPVVEGSGPDSGGVEGVVATERGPLEGAVVAFYLDASSQFRGPAYVEVETDGDGRFFASISPGRYFLVVRKRAGSGGRFGPAGSGGRFGPLSVGDHFGYYAYNPLVLKTGKMVTVRVAAVEVLRRTGWKEPSALRTRLTGTLRDSRGTPLPGYRVFLHSGPEMLGRPDFVSEESGSDGSFEIWAERAGTFYLGARREIGQARVEGEAVGYYTGSPDHSIAVGMDGREMSGLDVVVGQE
jgi:hypothetical protein